MLLKASDNMLTAGATAPAATKTAPVVSTTCPREKNITIDRTVVHCSKRGASTLARTGVGGGCYGCQLFLNDWGCPQSPIPTG